jgi:THAP domain
MNPYCQLKMQTKAFYYAFLFDYDRSPVWLEACNMDSLPNTNPRVCSNHFVNTDFKKKNTNRYGRMAFLKLHYKTAVPKNLSDDSGNGASHGIPNLATETGHLVQVEELQSPCYNPSAMEGCLCSRNFC